jgi:type IV pilus assembly protein PilN
VTTQTTVVGSPTLPRVNLLPPEIAEARQLRNIRVAAGGAVAATAVLVGVFYWHSHGGIATAQQTLDAANANTAKLQTQLKSYQNVTAVQAEVASAKSTLASAVGSQVLWSRYMQDMSVSLAGNYWFNSVIMSSNTTSTGGAAAASTPFSDPSAIGSITLNGTAVSHFDVADLLRDLAKEKGLSHPVANNSTEGVAGNDLRLVTFGVVVPVDSTQQPTSATPAGGATTPTKAAGH